MEEELKQMLEERKILETEKQKIKQDTDRMKERIKAKLDKALLEIDADFEEYKDDFAEAYARGASPRSKLEEEKTLIRKEAEKEISQLEEQTAKKLAKLDQEIDDQNIRIEKKLTDIRNKLYVGNSIVKNKIQDLTEKEKALQEELRVAEGEYELAIMKATRGNIIQNIPDTRNITILKDKIEEISKQKAELIEESEKTDKKIDDISKFFGKNMIKYTTVDDIYRLVLGIEKKEKQETEEQETEKQETEKQETEEQETEKQETEKQETEKQETEKQETEEQETEKQETGEQETEKQETGEQGTGEQEKLFTYEVTSKGISYDGKLQEKDVLLSYNETKYKKFIIAELGEKVAQELFDRGDKYLISSIIKNNGFEIEEDNKMMMTKEAKEKLEAYYQLLNNPTSKEKSRVDIKYDLREMSWISRLIKKCELDKETVEEIKEIAFCSRNVAEVITGPITAIQFKFKEIMERVKIPKLEAGSTKVETVEEQTSVTSSQSTRNQFKDDLRIEPEGTVQKETVQQDDSKEEILNEDEER